MKISIITPSYNQASYIERTIQSVLKQVGDFELEYIIIDGQSTDGTVDIIKRVAAQDSRIQWRSEPDQGQSDAINKGMRLATGDVVAYLNSDDVYLPGALQRVTEFFLAHPTRQWAYGKCKIINEQDKEIRHAITWYKNQWLRYYHYSTLLALNYISQPACFWRRAVMSEIGEFSAQQHLVMDYEYWLRLGAKYFAGVMPAYLASFRSYRTNKSSNSFRQQFREEYTVANQFIDQRSWLRILHWLHYHGIIFIYTVLA